MKHFKQFFVFALLALFSVSAWGATATYTVASTSTVDVAGAPTDATVSYSSTYSSKEQLTAGNSMTLTLSGYTGYKITAITLSMKSNSSKGAGSFSAVAGSTTIASISDAKFNDASWNGAWSTSYVNITPTMSDDDYEIQSGEDVVLTISASANSLYCNSFTIAYEEVGGSSDVIVKTLKSIAVAGMTTSYDQGDVFSFDGTCTATYSVTKNDVPQADENKIVTPTSVTSPDMTTTGDKTITVTYTEDAVTKTTTYDITVNTHVITPGEYGVLLDNVLWGVTSGQQAAGVTSLSGRANDIDFTMTKGGSQMYASATQTRFYSGATLTISAPTGFVITSIVFAEPTTDKRWDGSITADEDAYDEDLKTWAGSAQSVQFSFGAQNRIATATVTFEAEAADAPSVTISPVAVDATAAAVADGLIDATYENIALASVAVGLYNDAECNETFTDGWLTASLNGDKDIAYTLTENTGAARTAYIKLTAPASNGTSPDVVKIIEVSQAKGIPTYTALDAIFEAATSSEQTVKVAFNNWVISAVNGANAYLTDGTYGLIIYQSDHGFSAGDVLSGIAQATLVLYKGSAELKSLTATTDGLTVSAGGTVSARVLDAEGAAALTGANAGSLIKISGECTETSSKYYIQGIQLFNSLYSYDTPTAGNVYDCTGIFLMYNSTKEILPRQDGDLVPSAVTPTAVITFEDFSIEKGQNTTLAATVAPAVAASAEVTYSIVDGGEYVSLAGDVLTATEVGSAHIRATVADGTGYYGNTKEITVTVTAADTRYKAEQTGFDAISGTLTTVTEGAHKNKQYISYEGKQGNSANAPSIYDTDKIRLYQNGGLLVIGAAKGCKIDQVFLTTGGTYNTTTIGYSTSELSIASTGDAVAKNTEWNTATGLNTDTVVIVCLGTDKYTRIDVAKLDVRYTGDPVEVSSIALSGTYQTEFEKNAVFDHTGLIVTATYSDASVADVTALAEFSKPDMTTPGVKTVTVSYGGKSTTYDIEVVAAALSEIQLSGSYPTQFAQGDAFSHAGMTVTAVYSDASETDVTDDATFSGYDMFGAGSQMVTVAYGGKEATYSILVVPENTDVLTAAGIAAEGSSYADWSNKTFSTSAKYAGHSFAGNTDAIQIRTSGSVEGIVVTAQNGTKVVKSVTVNFATAPSGTRKLQVYGKHSAYSTAADLFSAEADTQGELIGELAADGTVDCTAADYEFIGVRSYDGAMYLAYVMVTWGDATPTPTKEVIRGELSAGKWGTICPKQTVENVEGASFYQITYLEEQNNLPYNVVFDQIEGTTLTAGKPYFFIAEGEEIRGIKTGDAVTSGSNVNGFYGYIGASPLALPNINAEYTAGADNTFVIYNNSVFRINSATNLKSERCYININATEPTRTPSSASPVRRRIVMGVQNTNTATGMDELNASEAPRKMIIDGKMYIFRGEKMYNANGQLVK